MLPTPDPQSLERICRDHAVARLWLFGSVLRDDFRDDSDVDVLVEFLPSARVGLLALARVQRELSALFGRRVDLVPVLGLKPAIRDAILGTRELLYAA